MSVLTPAAALALALKCVPPAMAPLMVGVAEHESGLDPTLIHLNPNGTRDYGISGINETNFGWLGLTAKTAMDPCLNLAAGAKVMIAKYNGNGTDPMKAAYAASVLAHVSTVPIAPAVPAAPQVAANPFSRPLRTGRDVVFMSAVERK
jgi:hypothetical protein